MTEDGESTKGEQPVTISAPPAASVTVDPQNPLPEPSFFWRRTITIGVTGFALLLAWITAQHLYEMHDAGRLYGLTRLVIMGAGLILTYYFIAPSAAELTSMIQSAKIIRSGITLAGKSPDTPQNGPQTAPVGDSQDSTAPYSHFSDDAPDGPSGGSEEDAAPVGRT